MERKLASIQRIKHLRQIEGADNIECATILGWECVVKKGEFKQGDLCVFFEIDSVLPDEKLFEFMRPRGFRVKTVRLRGQISQGLALPIACFSLQSDQEGDDLTAFLGIKKYEPPVTMHMDAAGMKPWPSFLHKTDQPRMQLITNLPEFLRLMPLSGWRVTEKLDGMSATYYLKDDRLGVCSRNAEWEEKEGNIYWEISKKYDLERKIKYAAEEWGIKNVAVQGEIIGPKIQGNKYNLIKNSLRIFDVFDIDRSSYLDRREFECFFNYMQYSREECHAYRVKVVDTIVHLKEYLRMTEIELHDDDALRKACIEISRALSMENSTTLSEGIVIKHDFEKIIPGWGRASFKVINPEFLLKYDE